jgi:antitoxin component YwqK of YwqJK toxin-antitoxin module
MPDRDDVRTELAEVRHSDGKVKYRYTRYIAADGKRWIRHGEFRAYYPSGAVASEGNYAHGHEEGAWKDFHENGSVAAQGTYRVGKEHGEWLYYGENGQLEERVEYADGVELKRPSKKKPGPELAAGR